MSTYKRLEDLMVYQRLCGLHIDVCKLSHGWPAEEKFELGSQARRSSNSSPAQLAEKYDDRHVRNKIEGVNRSRGEAGETIHHLFMAHLKGYKTRDTYEQFRERYQECVRMLNGIERKLEQYLPERDRRWPEQRIQGSGFSRQGDELREEAPEYGNCPPGYSEPDPKSEDPNPEP